MNAFFNRGNAIAIASILVAVIVAIVLSKSRWAVSDRMRSHSEKIVLSGSSNAADLRSAERGRGSVRKRTFGESSPITFAEETKLTSEKVQDVLNSDLRAAFKEVELTKISREYVRRVGIQYALENINLFAGPGANQNLLLRLFFQEAADDQGRLIESARSIADHDASKSALDGVLRNMRMNGLDSQALNLLIPLKNGEENIFDEFVSGLINYKSVDNMKLLSIPSIIRKAYPNEADYSKHLKTFLLDVSESHPADALAYCRSLGNNLDIRNEIAQRCLLLMISRNSKDGMDQAISLYKENSAIVSSYSIRSMMTMFLEKDYDEGQAWIKENFGQLDQSSKDSINISLVNYDLKKKNLDGAREWLNQIVNPSDKSAAQGQIWEVERDELRNDVGNDPAGTLQSIVSGKSKYGDYWLEEAVATWVSKDFNSANDWYQQNWKSLPASKAQYVAAAFANQAVSQGDTTTARQWSGLIQDPKTKQRIDAGIAKAESQPKH